MSRRPAFAVILALLLSLTTGPAVAAPPQFSPGADSAGDPYFPGDGNGKWVWVPDDDQPDQPHDDSKDHVPCPDCNYDGKGKDPGWYNGATLREHCKRCDGAGWL